MASAVWPDAVPRATAPHPAVVDQLPKYGLQKPAGPTHADCIAVRAGAPDADVPCCDTPPKLRVACC
jgi:hypothetical protein